MNADPGQQLILIISFVGLLLILMSVSYFEYGLTFFNKQQLNEVELNEKRQAKLDELVNKQNNYIARLKLARILFGSLSLLVLFKLSEFWFDKQLTLIKIVFLALLWAIIEVVLGYSLPKFLALKSAKQKLDRYLGVIKFLSLLMAPLAGICQLLTMKLKTQGLSENKSSWQNIVEMIEEGRANGELDSDDFEMIDGVISMHDKMAREVMVPRIDAFMIDITNDNNRSIDDILQMDYSRVPIYHEDKDKVIGVVHIKNLIKAARRFGFDHVTIRQVMQPAFFVPETITIDQLLYEMKKTQNQMAILLDEYGGVVGLVTLEDLIEEIVGEIEDESDEPQEEIQKLAEGQYLVTARMSLDDFNDEFGCNLEMSDVDTLGGYLIGRLGVIPDQDEVVTTSEELRLQVAQMQGDRIIDVKVILPPNLNQYRLQREQEKRDLQIKMGLS